jgi:uncharacterized protein YjbI with pentapeptide repeats
VNLPKHPAPKSVKSVLTHYFLPSLGLGLCSVILAGFAQPTYAFNPEHLQQLRRTKQCPGCDLSYADLSGWKLEGADLSGANLNAANLRKARLSSAKLIGANLNHADLAKAILNQANLSQATLVFTRFEEAVLNQANLTNAVLGGYERLSTVKSLNGAILPNGRPATENAQGRTSI